MTKTFFSALILLVLFSANTFSQNLNKLNFYNKDHSNYIKDGFIVISSEDDTSKILNGKNKVQKTNISGLFLAPNIGIGYPLATFASNSAVGFVWGAKLEFAFSKLYPFVPGLIFESQSYNGAAGFISNNLLTSFKTDIIYYGGSFDIILNKFIRSDFTTPVFSGEVKFATVTRTVSPDVTLAGITDNETLLTYSASLAFTLYVVDLGVKYTYASEYSNLALQMKIHFPLIKF